MKSVYKSAKLPREMKINDEISLYCFDVNMKTTFTQLIIKHAKDFQENLMRIYLKAENLSIKQAEANIYKLLVNSYG